MLDNNGILGRNRIVCRDHLSPKDRENLKGFMLSAFELKAELQSHKAPPKPTKTGKARKPREGKAEPNVYLDLFRRISSYDVMLPKVEDLFMGAIRQHTNGSTLNPYVIFGLMKSLPEITTEAVYVVCNQRRVASEVMGMRYAQQLANACRNVIRVFDHYEEEIARQYRELEQNPEALDSYFNVEADAEAYRQQPKRESLSKPDLTERLRKAGLSPIEIGRYLAGQRIGYSHKLRAQAGLRIVLRGQPVGHHDDENKTSHYKREFYEWRPEQAFYVDTQTGEILNWST